MKRYVLIWWVYTLRMTQIAFTSRLGVVIFTIGKLLRFGLLLFFLYSLLSNTRTLAGYTIWEVYFFFATFNFIDSCAQFFLRDVYRFRMHVVSGFFDTYLIKPISPLFKALFGGSDVLDIPMIFLSIGLLIIASQHVITSLSGIVLYILLLANSLVIALSLHIFIISLGILTTEIDNTLWMYRDLTQMARVPVDIYQEPIRSIITFVVPVGIMMTFPVKAMMGLLSVESVIISFLIGLIFIVSSLYFWNFALKQYSSASS